jgi:uncharacterized protein
MPFGLSDKIFSLITSTLSENENIESAILFGSRAKGNFKPGSDIDIALKGPKLSIEDILQLQSVFDGFDQPYTFDIVVYQNITSPELISHIDRLGIEFYKKNK